MIRENSLSDNPLTQLKTVGLFAIASMASFQVWGTPVIQAVEGNLAAQSEIRIVGKNFSTVPRGFDLKDESDSFSYLTSSTAFSMAGYEDLWMTRGGTWAKPLLPVTLEESGVKRRVYQGKGKAYNQYLKPLDKETNDTLYVSWLYKPSESPGHAGGSNKFIRVWDNHNGEETRISWTVMHMTYSGYTTPSWAGWSGQVGQWNKMELWIDGPRGRIEAKINGKTVHDIDDFAKRPNGIGLKVKLLGFDPNRGTPYANMITHIDNLFVSTTRARVVLSDQPEWSDGMLEEEVLIPSTWTDSEIVLNLDVDGRDLAEKKYVYVVDKDGVANNKGYELCVRCPKPPQLTAN